MNNKAVVNTKNKANVATPSPRFAQLELERKLCRTLYKGTKAMQEAKGEYLPKHPAESEPAYKVRLDMNILTNFLKRDVKKAANKIFSSPVVLKENVPKEIVAICENIDRQGKGLDAFMLDRAEQALLDGLSYILVDAPKANASDTQAGELSVATARRLNIRPYAIPIDASQLLEVVAEMINGVQTITRIRILENITTPDAEWGFNTVQQVRVFRRVAGIDAKGEANATITYELFRQAENGDWVSKETGATGFSRIPLVAAYANQCGYMEGEPVFQETAELNLKHWRSNSEQTFALTMGRFAMLSAVGIEDGDNIEVGSSKLLRSASKDAKFAYVESNGTGLDQGWKDLENIAKDADKASATLRIENAGKVTATASAIDNDDSTAGLKAVALSAQNSIEQLLQLFAELLGIEGEKAGGEVEVNTTFGAKKGTDAGWTELGKARTDGTLSKDAWLREAQYRGELSPDFDLVANKTQREDEANSSTETPTAEEQAAAKLAKEAKSKKKETPLAEEQAAGD